MEKTRPYFFTVFLSFAHVGALPAEHNDDGQAMRPESVCPKIRNQPQNTADTDADPPLSFLLPVSCTLVREGLGCCSCRVCVCRCRGCCSLSVCVCGWVGDLLIF